MKWLSEHDGRKMNGWTLNAGPELPGILDKKPLIATLEELLKKR
jgi:hypothetical protein